MQQSVQQPPSKDGIQVLASNEKDLIGEGSIEVTGGAPTQADIS